MRHTIQFLLFILFTALLVSCGSGTKGEQLFVIQTQGNKSEFQQNEAITLTIGNKKNKVIEKVTYTIDAKVLQAQNEKYPLDIKKLGNKTLTAKIEFEGSSVEVSKKIKILAPNPPEIYTYEIINEYPHDINAYTQGLEFYKDTLYESTGQKGKSSLRKVNFKTGEVLQQINLDASYFGEGITVLNQKIIQLTWQSNIGFVYDVAHFEKIDQFSYGESKEGWGLCNDGTKIYKSDGTEKIWILNPDTLIEEDHIEIVTDKSIFNKANELEYVDGKIYANVYQKESMMIINATTGAIEGVINFGGLKEKVTQHDALDVLNGVAYHPERKTFFVTGKNWDKLFEVHIKKK
ncbi:glutaminyl-peptide cyclotransferase [Arenibacter sp. GZD96]|uniref:glutaminyl-peptide cyclotransferase n=1 Tax=Aurantibrevibacter litoralis TaxID=3106030 RepID=UPI002AFF0ECA|nr:glutaminyl-peptide cyclotransferase [Arenibacter sp. GZD-96]MEA1787365.1 glutaminyl-peptide cyclotransferase [Arenibacter sp. GZD-96]